MKNIFFISFISLFLAFSSGHAQVRSAAMQPGTLFTFAGTTCPAGSIAADGSSLLRAGKYANLFTAISTTWGAADGTHFTVPSLARRVLMGSGGSGTATISNTVGSTGGEETHTLITGEMPAHSHTFNTNSAGFIATATSGSGGNYGFNGVLTGTPVTLNNTGGGGAHNNIQPAAIIKFCLIY